jgi:hypothetical protein
MESGAHSEPLTPVKVFPFRKIIKIKNVFKNTKQTK